MVLSYYIQGLKDITNVFNEYFENIGKNLASQIDDLDNNGGYKQYLDAPTEKNSNLNILLKMRQIK